LKKNEEPITQDFFTQLENDIYKKQIVKTLINDSSADVDYRAVDKNAFQNYDDYASIPISFYGSPIRSAFGNARLRIPKNTTYEDAEIEIFDKYDFGMSMVETVI